MTELCARENSSSWPRGSVSPKGRVWLADHGCLLFTDIPGNAILRWDGADLLDLDPGNAHFAIGLTRDRRGRGLIALRALHTEA